MITVTLYTRPNCASCDEARRHLQLLQEAYPHRLVEIDVEQDDALAEMRRLVPVLEVGPYRLQAPFTPQALQATLGAARERARYQDGEALPISEPGAADRALFFFARHYLAFLNLLLALYVGLPFLAPLLMKVGAELPARVIYTVYSPFCHQFGFRSWFLFGEQAYYPLGEAEISGVRTFEEISGLLNLRDPTSPSRLAARAFIGNEQVGYKVALCERDVAIYGAMLLFGLVFALMRRSLRPLHPLLWVLIGLFPIGLDGFSQLFSQFELSWLLSFLPYRESTPWLRTLTGFLFGFSTAWLMLPYIEESMRETRRLFIRKFALAAAS